jgi:hypothetical protein
MDLKFCLKYGFERLLVIVLKRLFNVLLERLLVIVLKRLFNVLLEWLFNVLLEWLFKTKCCFQDSFEMSHERSFAIFFL